MSAELKWQTRTAMTLTFSWLIAYVCQAHGIKGWWWLLGIAPTILWISWDFYHDYFRTVEEPDDDDQTVVTSNNWMKKAPPAGRTFVSESPLRPMRYHKTRTDAHNSLRPKDARRWNGRAWPVGKVWEWDGYEWQIIYMKKEK